MRRILGTRDQYYDQIHTGQVEFFKDYAKKFRSVACGPTSAAMCLAIAGWPMNVFTPGETPQDAIMMVEHNPANLPRIMAARKLDYDQFPPNEVPQTYPTIMEIIYGRKDVCAFAWGLDFVSVVCGNIDKGNPMMICGKFPAGGHYVAVVGYDDEKKVLIYNDPYPVQWSDKIGYNREMDADFFQKNIQKWRVEFYNRKALP